MAGKLSARRGTVGLLLGLALLAITVTAAAQSPSQPATGDAREHRLLLVLPFENRTSQANLDWIGEAVPEILNQRLASAGFMPIGRLDRQYALDHLGLPANFQPSRATTIRIAQSLDADYVVVGSYTVHGDRFGVTAQILDVNALHLGQPLQQEADMTRLLDVLNSAAWRVARRLDPRYSVEENTFVAASSGLRLDGFEDYVRGLDEPNSADRIRRLKEAAQLNPKFSNGWLALGQAYFAAQQYELAATAFGHMKKDDPSALYAEFDRGLAFFYTGNYAKAEDAFGFIAGQLPLAEVLNNEGVALARRGLDGSSFFRKAVANDPADEDYSFNLAVALNRRGDRAGALSAVQQALTLRPGDAEAQQLLNKLRGGATAVASSFTAPPESHALASTDPSAPSAGPLERIERSFNDAAFRQAAFAMEQIESTRLDAMPPAQHAAALTREGQQHLAEGLILEAERQFQSALALDSSNAAAYAGLADVRTRSGDETAARREAEASIKLKPNAAAYIVLARLDLAASQLHGAALDIEQAIALEPSNVVAKNLRQTILERAASAQKSQKMP